MRTERWTVVPRGIQDHCTQLIQFPDTVQLGIREGEVGKEQVERRRGIERVEGECRWAEESDYRGIGGKLLRYRLRVGLRHALASFGEAKPLQNWWDYQEGER